MYRLVYPLAVTPQNEDVWVTRIGWLVTISIMEWKYTAIQRQIYISFLRFIIFAEYHYYNIYCVLFLGIFLSCTDSPFLPPLPTSFTPFSSTHTAPSLCLAPSPALSHYGAILTNSNLMSLLVLQLTITVLKEMIVQYLNIVSVEKFERGPENLIRYYQSKECGLSGPQLVTTSRVFWPVSERVNVPLHLHNIWDSITVFKWKL